MKLPRPAILVLVFIAASLAAATAKPRAAWTETETSDPVTGAKTCTVAAYDRFGKFHYSRAGFLCPIVEKTTRYDLLVGVSTGGPYRLPSGDILWRIDDKPFRELSAEDNPGSSQSPPVSPPPTGNAATDKAIADAMASSAKLVSSLTATSTVASGAKAQEMLGGSSLIFRAKSAVPDYGLPSDKVYRVGQLTSEGMTPIPLDNSFRAGLAACGIAVDPI